MRNEGTIQEGAQGPAGPTGQSYPTFNNGVIQLLTAEAVCTGTTSAGTVTFAVSNSGSPIFDSILPASANPWVPSTSQNYIFGTPTLSPDKLSITLTVKQQTFSGIVVLSTNVLGSVAFTNPPDGTTVSLRILGIAH